MHGGGTKVRVEKFERQRPGTAKVMTDIYAKVCQSSDHGYTRFTRTRERCESQTRRNRCGACDTKEPGLVFVVTLS
jgi:hypothetical protein